MATVHSDAFVFFGATGDLAFKQIFPALQGLIRDEGFDLPIIGIARSGDLSSLKDRARQSLEASGGVDPVAGPRLPSASRRATSDCTSLTPGASAGVLARNSRHAAIASATLP